MKWQQSFPEFLLPHLDDYHVYLHADGVKERSTARMPNRVQKGNEPAKREREGVCAMRRRGRWGPQRGNSDLICVSLIVEGQQQQQQQQDFMLHSSSVRTRGWFCNRSDWYLMKPLNFPTFESGVCCFLFVCFLFNVWRAATWDSCCDLEKEMQGVSLTPEPYYHSWNKMSAKE